MRERWFDILFLVAGVSWSFCKGTLSYEAWKQNAWDASMPLVWCLCAIFVKHAFQSAHQLVKELRLEYAIPATTSISPILSPDGKQIEQTLFHKPPLFYQARIYGIACLFLFALTGVGYLFWDRAQPRIPIDVLLPYVRYEGQQGKMRNWPYGSSGSKYPMDLSKFFVFDFKEATDQRGLNGQDRFFLYYMLKHDGEMKNAPELNDLYYKEFEGMAGSPVMQSMDKLANLGLIDRLSPLEARLSEPYYSRYRGKQIPGDLPKLH